MENEDQKLQEVASAVFEDLLDSMIVDVASEAHRAARLGLDPRLDINEEEEIRLSVQARAAVGDPSTSGSERGRKYNVDMFGQKLPAVATETFKCMNCNRSVIAGRFAPHLEKCMGKGRKTRLTRTRDTNATSPQKRARSSPISTGVGATKTPALIPYGSQRTGAEMNSGLSNHMQVDANKVVEQKSKRAPGQHTPKWTSKRSLMNQT